MGQDLDHDLRKLYVRTALKDYIEQSQKFRSPGCPQLFMTYRHQTLGKPVISSIALRHRHHNIIPSSSSSWCQGSSDKESVCFVRRNGWCLAGSYLQVDKVVFKVQVCQVLLTQHVAQVNAEFGKRVVQVAGSSAAAKGIKSKYHLQNYKIPKLKKA